ncbi:MAG: transcription elongation factor Spt5 [Nanoarchaeota archaeon]|nr:transcription elongation factor Spt5 [Nanoarchaeota archaeon]
MTEEEQKQKKEEEIEEVDESLTDEDVVDILKIKTEKIPEKEEPAQEKPELEEEKIGEKSEEEKKGKIIIGKEKKETMNPIFALRTTANREEQVLDFVTSNVEKKGLDVYSIISPHGLRGYIFLEAKDRQSAEESFQGVPYARGLLPNLVKYEEIEHMLEQVKREINIQKSDIVEIISGPFKREQAKVTRIDQQKEEVIVELLESAIPIPVTVKIDSVKVVRRESEEEPEEEKEE